MNRARQTPLILIFLVTAGLLVAAPPVQIWPRSATSTAAAVVPTSLPPAASTEQLAARARPSLAVITNHGRNGAKEGIGTGFVISADGLIATSLHVVGEARPIGVRLADGRTVDVIAIHAFDRHADLAILRVGATNLTSLSLGDSDSLVNGADIIVLGNPLGLENSVVTGVLSGRRTFDETEMLQIAVPIEPGNSGGPLIDRSGRVLGIVNAKAVLTRNLGFATPVNLLKTLVEKPNPVPMATWIRAGALDPSTWEPHYGALWREKAGRLLVDGVGSGFGGRAYLLHTARAPLPPFELTVTVRLEDESGAAGLVFLGDDEDRHYGFYPTDGQLRLTAFEGPDIFSWRILGTVPSAQYRRNDWNTLQVRVGTNGFTCLVNGQAVFNSTDTALHGTRVGIAKFRETAAQFRSFAVGRSLLSAPDLPSGLVKALGGQLEPEAQLSEADLGALRTHLGAARSFLADRARRLEQEAERLRELAARLHREVVGQELSAELLRAEAEIDLGRAALLVARYDLPDLDPLPYLRQLDTLAREVRGRSASDAPAVDRVDALRNFLFAESGFHGSRHDYYNRSNSRLNDVLDDREGLPITLSVLFMEVAQRAGLTDVYGVALPGHFLVKHAPSGAQERLIDVFNGGRFLTHSEADELGSGYAGVPVRSEFLRPATKREIIVRMVTNLQGFTERSDGAAASLHYSDLLVTIAGDPRAEAGQRIDRARLRAVCGDPNGARADLRWILEAAPPGVDVKKLAEIYRRLVEE